jgi:methylthioxylose transferase
VFGIQLPAWARDPVTPPGTPAGKREEVDEPGPSAGAARWAAAGWVALIAAGFGVGAVLRNAGALPVDPVPPLHAHARLLIVPLLPAVVVALAGVAVLPAAARRMRWRRLLAFGWAASALWAVILQWPDGVSRPLTAQTEYLAGLPAVGDHPLTWLRGFTRHLQEYPTHVKGHPPLPELILWTMRWTGLDEPVWAATLVIAAGASATVAIAMTVRTLADERTARRAVPFLILTPAAICLATSMDALFLGVAAWSVALIARAAAGPREDIPLPPGGPTPLPSSSPVDSGHKGLHGLWITVRRWYGGEGYPQDAGPEGAARLGVAPGATGPEFAQGGAPQGSVQVRTRWGSARSRTREGSVPGRTRRGPVIALAAGLATGSLPYLSYGLLTILALPFAVLLLTRPRRGVLLAYLLGCAIVPLAFTAAGFRWWDGVAGTHAAWAAGAGSDRPYAYFLLGDLAVLALIVGPVPAVVLPYVLRRGRALGLLAAAALIGVLALDLSGVTRGEVERIWLPYAAWMTAAAAVYRPPARRALLVQAVIALLLQALVRSPW